MSRLIIPTIGDKIRLTAPWEFPLFNEYRNRSAVAALHPQLAMERSEYGSRLESVPTTLPVGAVLQFDRYYIRRGKGDWDSITFKLLTWPDWVTKKGTPRPCKCRFWAKLEDCNFIEFEPVPEGVIT